MLQRILCWPWLKWVLMGAGGLTGFMVTRKRSKKAIVKVGAAGAGVGLGWVTWLLINKACYSAEGPGWALPEGYDDVLPDTAPSAKTPPIPDVYERPPGTGTPTDPEVLRRGGEAAVPVPQPMAPAPTPGTPGTPGATTTSMSRTRADGMFRGAYGS